MDIGNIVNGHINELLGLNKDIAEIRINICKKCPIYSPRMGGICNSKLWINPETDDVSLEPLDGYVRGCGCLLAKKTSIPNEKCVINKW